MNPNINNSTNSITDTPIIMYYGVVESISDNLKLNRVRVRIFGIHNDNRKILKTEDLPYAIVVNSTNTPSTKLGVGGHKLQVGTMVVGYFLDPEDLQQFIVMGSIYSKIKTDSKIALFSLDDIQNPGAVFITSENNTKSNKIEAAKNTTVVNSGNPLGRVDSVVVANGKDGGTDSMFVDINTQITSLGNIFKYVELYDVDNIVLGEDIDREISFIPLTNSLGGFNYQQLPPKGIIRIDKEIISYSDVNTNGLSGTVVRGSPDLTSIVPTAKSSHSKGTTVEWIYPIIKNDKSPLVFSKVTGQAINFGKEVKRITKIIRGYITWFVNQVSAYASSLVADAISKISLYLKSPTPLLIKTIVDALLSVASQIICSLGTATVDSIVASIETMIIDKINELLQSFYTLADSISNFIESCSSKIFDGIMQLVSIVQSVTTLVSTITDKLPIVSGKANKLLTNVKDTFSGKTKLSLGDITGAGTTIVTLLNFLGVGCSNTVSSSDSTYTSCTNYSNILDCNTSNPDLISTLNTWSRPLAEFLDEQNYGGGIVTQYDSTPGVERLLIQGPSATSVEVFNDGTKKTVITKDNYKIVLGSEYIQIQGDVAIKIDGNLSTKVSGNYDLEVGGEYRVNIASSSQITYGSSHTLKLLGDSTINATNKLDIIGTKIGLAGSNGVDIAGGTLSATVSEINLTSLGSLNLMSVYRNDIIGVADTYTCSGTRITLCAGSETNVNSSVKTSSIVGAHTINNMSTFNINAVGVATLNFSGLLNMTSSIKTEDVKGLYQFSANSIFESAKLKTTSVDGLNVSSANMHVRTSSSYNIDN